jgi:cytochrome c oxidase assembly protein subunit 15
MVSSGLVDRLDVSQYRLATHLSMAFVILGLTLWTALELRYGKTSAGRPGFSLAALFWAAVLLQIALGAFVAGLDAGRIYTTWPGFQGQLLPRRTISAACRSGRRSLKAVRPSNSSTAGSRAQP